MRSKSTGTEFFSLKELQHETAFCIAIATLSIVVGATDALADVTISQWNFGTVESAPYNSPTPDVGSGTASVLGMTNNYTFSSGNTITGSGTFIPGVIDGTVSTPSADITTVGTPADPNGFLNAWRIRGPSNAVNGTGGLGNGWALQAPQYSQGAQFSSIPLDTPTSSSISTGSPRLRA